MIEVAEPLAAALQAGEQTHAAARIRAAQALGSDWRFLGPLVRRYLAAFDGAVRPRHKEVVAFLLKDEGFRRARRAHRLAAGIPLGLHPSMQPVSAASSWGLPVIASEGALAEWLGVTPEELEWFADLRGTAVSGALSHYHFRVLAKGNGAARLIESPKPRLKQMQRRILLEILNRVPPHPAAHGFVRGRSIRTFASPHVARRVVLKIDLRDFFPSISGARIQTIFRLAGYPERVADLLGGLCTSVAPRTVRQGFHCDVETRDLYRRPHLPQGAPTSPALANICSYRFDCRLSGLAEAAGAVYTRYADDLAFSGGEPFERCVSRFAIHVAAILEEEGFAVQHRKTRVMRQGVRQYLAGVVVNDAINVVRADYDRLKAILTNCARHGLASQNREGHPDFRAHLDGRVSFVEMLSPAKGAKLRGLLDLCGKKKG